MDTFKRITFIVNPKSGTQDKDDIPLLIDEMLDKLAREEEEKEKEKEG